MLLPDARWMIKGSFLLLNDNSHGNKKSNPKSDSYEKVGIEIADNEYKIVSFSL